jgi:hypothetical protein
MAADDCDGVKALHLDSMTEGSAFPPSRNSADDGVDQADRQMDSTDGDSVIACTLHP